MPSSSMENDEKKIPDHRKFWESPDFTISKTIEEEGDFNSFPPRFCSSGEIVVELLSVTGIPEDGVLSPRLSRYLSGATAFNQPVTVSFAIGSAETEIDRQMERGIECCLPGEVSVLTFRILLEPNQAVNPRVAGAPEPEWITLELRLHLVTLLHAEHINKWFNETKLTKAREFHADGVRLFKEKRYLDAFHKFKLSYKLAVLAKGIETDNYAESESARQLQELCYNNLAACHFQWNNFNSVVELSSLVLESQTTNVKTLYRRGVSYMNLEEYDLAERDLVLARKLEPLNRAVNEKLGQAQQRRKASDAKMANRMSKMFVHIS